MPVSISALMFSALHFRYHSIQELLFAFCIGIVFAIYYQWYQNIIALIVTHTIIDFIAVLLTGFAEVYKQAHHML
jgi:membrane protease YdiL (CAAX protease family)